MLSGLCDFLSILMWYSGVKIDFSVKPLNLRQLQPKIPICLVINFQHLSNGSICRDSPNCLGQLLACAALAARNVALSFSPQLPAQLCLGQWSAWGGWATHGQACRSSGPRGRRDSPSLETYVNHSTYSQWVQVQNAEVMDLIPTSPPP